MGGLLAEGTKVMRAAGYQQPAAFCAGRDNAEQLAGETATLVRSEVDQHFVQTVEDDNRILLHKVIDFHQGWGNGFRASFPVLFQDAGDDLVEVRLTSGKVAYQAQVQEDGARHAFTPAAPVPQPAGKFLGGGGFAHP